MRARSRAELVQLVAAGSCAALQLLRLMSRQLAAMRGPSPRPVPAQAGSLHRLLSSSETVEGRERLSRSPSSSPAQRMALVYVINDLD